MLGTAIGVGALAAEALLDWRKHSLPPRDPRADERFRSAQEKAFAVAGLRATARFVNAPRMRVQVIEAGAGAPVLFVHGGNSVAAGWTPLLARLQDRFRLLAPDRPGCGLTDQLLYSGVDLRAHAVEWVGAVMDALGLQRASLVGNSMGGYWSLAFALAHPQRVEKLALLGEAAGSAQRASLFHRLAGTRGINSLLYATALRPRGTAASSRDSLVRGKLVVHADRIAPELLDCLAAGAALPGAVQSWITMVERAANPPALGLFSGDSPLTWALRGELGSLTMPALWIWGEKDPFAPPARGEEMARAMPHGRCVVLPDAGHLPWLEEPDRCAQLVSEFLA